MTNNINNLNGYNAVNYQGKEKGIEQKAPKCEGNECKQAEASSLEAMSNAGKAQVIGPYKYDPENTRKDVEEFEKAYAKYADEALDVAFKGLQDFAIKNYGA